MGGVVEARPATCVRAVQAPERQSEEDRFTTAVSPGSRPPPVHFLHNGDCQYGRAGMACSACNRTVGQELPKMPRRWPGKDDIAWDFEKLGGGYTGRMLIHGQIHTPREATKGFLKVQKSAQER